MSEIFRKTLSSGNRICACICLIWLSAQTFLLWEVISFALSLNYIEEVRDTFKQLGYRRLVGTWSMHVTTVILFMIFIY